MTFLFQCLRRISETSRLLFPILLHHILFFLLSYFDLGSKQNKQTTTRDSNQIGEMKKRLSGSRSCDVSASSSDETKPINVMPRDIHEYPVGTETSEARRKERIPENPRDLARHILDEARAPSSLFRHAQNNNSKALTGIY